MKLCVSLAPDQARSQNVTLKLPFVTDLPAPPLEGSMTKLNVPEAVPVVVEKVLSVTVPLPSPSLENRMV